MNSKKHANNKQAINKMAKPVVNPNMLYCFKFVQIYFLLIGIMLS